MDPWGVGTGQLGVGDNAVAGIRAMRLTFSGIPGAGMLEGWRLAGQGRQKDKDEGVGESEVC